MRDFFSDVRMLLAMIDASARGIYKVPYRTIFFGAVGIIYLLLPVDIIPDLFIPGIGLIDDVVVMKLCWDQCMKDVDNYRLKLQDYIKRNYNKDS